MPNSSTPAYDIENTNLKMIGASNTTTNITAPGKYSMLPFLLLYPPAQRVPGNGTLA